MQEKERKGRREKEREHEREVSAKETKKAAGLSLRRSFRLRFY
jgi:hypothetical protein